MAFVGSTELVLLEIAAVAFVGLTIAQLSRVLLREKFRYSDLTKKISWAPPSFLFGVVWSLMYLILQPIALYRIRILGNWEAGVNQTALILFWVLQLALVLYNFLYILNLWLGFVAVLVSLGLAITTTILFFPLDTAAGILMLPLDVWLLFATILALAVAIKNPNPTRVAPSIKARVRTQVTNRQQTF